MFTGYESYGDYGAYGRSLRKSISRATRSVTRAPIRLVRSVAKPVTKAVKAITKPVSKITGKVIKPVTGAFKKIGSKFIRPVGQEEESGAMVYEDENGNPISEAEYKRLMAEYEASQVAAAQVPTTRSEGFNPPTPSEGASELQRQMLEYMKMMAEMQQRTQAMQQAPTAPVYMPTAAPSQEYQQQEEESVPYYSEQNYPTEEGSAIREEFRMQEPDYSEYDEFEGLGELGDELRAMIDPTPPPPLEQIDAGQNRIVAAQTTNTGPATAPKKPNVPNWLVAAGVAGLLYLVFSSPSKR